MIKGSIVALVTPFTESLHVNFKKLEEMVEIQYMGKTDCLLLLGSTSESSTLNEYEKDSIVECVIKKNSKRMKIIVAVITNNLVDAITKSRKYEELGADCLLIIPPYYVKSNENGIFEYFKEISNKINIPMIIYNIPTRVGFNLDYKTIQKLKKIKKIIGIKESNKDINHIIKISTLCDEKFYLYGGNDDLIYVFLTLGAKGLINVYGNLEPKVIKNLINLYEVNPFLCHRYFLNYYDIFDNLGIDVNPIPIKFLMNYKGLKVGNHRLPLSKLSEDKEKNIIKQLF